MVIQLTLLWLLIDGSGSQIEPFNSGDYPNKRKINVVLLDTLNLVESLPEGSSVMIASYSTNSWKIYALNIIFQLLFHIWLNANEINNL